MHAGTSIEHTFTCTSSSVGRNQYLGHRPSASYMCMYMYLKIPGICAIISTIHTICVEGYPVIIPGTMSDMHGYSDMGGIEYM